MRKQIIREYLTLPSYISSSFISAEELFWQSLPVAEVEGLDFCVNHDPGPGMSGNQGVIRETEPQPRTGRKQMKNLAPFTLTLLCWQCWQHRFSHFAVACMRLFDPWGNKCLSFQACGLKESRSTKRKLKQNTRLHLVLMQSQTKPLMLCSFYQQPWLWL